MERSFNHRRKGNIFISLVKARISIIGVQILCVAISLLSCSFACAQSLMTVEDTGSKLIYDTGYFAPTLTCQESEVDDLTECLSPLTLNSPITACQIACNDTSCARGCFLQYMACWDTMTFGSMSNCSSSARSPVPQFPPSKGILTGVRIIWNVRETLTFQFENLSPSGGSLVLVNAPILFAARVRLGATSQNSVPLNAVFENNFVYVARRVLAPRDSEIDFQGPAGWTDTMTPLIHSETFEFDQNLAPFVGTGSVLWYDAGDARRSSLRVEGGNGTTLISSLSAMQFIVEYDYVSQPRFPRLVK